ncbi:MAG: ornithine cyclodeaminase family protein [Chloroflexi bacterium]|nr:ornithine cyclodeaminase family protein [Chloroflexota bacterium]
MAILLRHEEIVDLLDWPEVLAAVRASFLEQAAGQAQLPPRITVDSASGHGWIRLMPAILNGSGIMGYKAMNVTPRVGGRYMVALYDLPSGALLAHLDADWLTQRRTAATAALGTDALAPQQVRQVGLLGSGEQARGLLAALAVVRAFQRAKVYSPTPANRERFAAELSAELGRPVEPVASPEAAVADCEVVGVALRPTTEPALRREWLAPGAHVAAISAVRPEHRELDVAIWQQATVLAVDDRQHVFESGDGRAALAAGVVPDRAVELWELLAGRHPGRTSTTDLTVFKSVGTGLQDLSLARAIYERARALGRGLDLGDWPHRR